MHAFFSDILPRRKLNIFRNINNHRTGTPCRRNQESFVNRPRQIVHVQNEVIMLGAAPRNANRIALLESVRSDQVRRHLPGKHDHRD